MSWFKVDDNLHSHEKARGAGLAAMGLWAVSGSYSSAYLTEGWVPRWFVVGWPSGAKLAAKLVAAGLWDESDDGWLFHQWDERNPSKEQVEAERAATKERQQKWRDTKRRNAERNGVTNSVTNGVTNTAPTRPDPLREKNLTQVDLEASPLVTGTSEERGGAKTPIDGWKLIRDLIPAEHPQAVRSGLAIEAATLLAAGTPEADVREALALWLSKPALGPRVLPSLVSEVIRTRAGPTAAARTGPSKSDAKVAGYLALANSLADHPQEIA